MRELINRIVSESRKTWLRTRPVFVRHAPVSSAEIDRIEQEVRTILPTDLREWLLEAGYGDVNEQLSFRREWFRAVEHGHLTGAVLFAQDELGNFYAYVPADGSIVYFCRSSPEYAVLASSFRDFMEELEYRAFKLTEWVDRLPTAPYCWDA